MKLVAREMESALSDSALLRQKLSRLATDNKGKPQAFKMRTQLLKQGRANIPVAATEDLTVIEMFNMQVRSTALPLLC
jgi:hypothetical protein